MSDAYTWWRKAIAEPHKIGTPDLPVHENEPQCGYFRTRDNEPAAIWTEEGALVAGRGQARIDPQTLWTWVCRTPVDYATYKKAVETGRWPDDPPNVASAEIGHNMPADPVEAMRIELTGEIEQAKEFLKQPVKDQTEADKAATWAKRLAALSKKSDDMRKVEKQPHMDAAKAVDDKFRDLVDDAKDFSNRLKRHLDSFLQEQARIEQERQRKAREEAERAQREAVEKARAAELEASRSSADAEQAKREAAEALERAAAAEREAQARNTSAGRTGAKVALREFTSGEITDRDAFLQAVKDWPEMDELLLSLSNRAARSGVTLPGMQIVKERRAA